MDVTREIEALLLLGFILGFRVLGFRVYGFGLYFRVYGFGV